MWAKAANLSPIFDIRVHDSCREFRLELLKFRQTLYESGAIAAQGG